MRSIARRGLVYYTLAFAGLVAASACVGGSGNNDPAASGPSTQFDYETLAPTTERVFNPYSYQGRVPKDSIRPIYEPRIMGPEESGLLPGELVIGVAIGGEARAYPIGMMNNREMANDEVGGVPILVSW